MNQRSHYIVTPRILISTTILAIARIEEDRLHFLPKVRQLLCRAHIIVVEVSTLGGLVAHVWVILDKVLSTSGLTRDTPSEMHMPASPGG